MNACQHFTCCDQNCYTAGKNLVIRNEHNKKCINLSTPYRHGWCIHSIRGPLNVLGGCGRLPLIFIFCGSGLYTNTSKKTNSWSNQASLTILRTRRAYRQCTVGYSCKDIPTYFRQLVCRSLLECWGTLEWMRVIKACTHISPKANSRPWPKALLNAENHDGVSIDEFWLLLFDVFWPEMRNQTWVGLPYKKQYSLN